MKRLRAAPTSSRALGRFRTPTSRQAPAWVLMVLVFTCKAAFQLPTRSHPRQVTPRMRHATCPAQQSMSTTTLRTNTRSQIARPALPKQSCLLLIFQSSQEGRCAVASTSARPLGPAQGTQPSAAAEVHSPRRGYTEQVSLAEPRAGSASFRQHSAPAVPLSGSTALQQLPLSGSASRIAASQAARP